MWDFLEGARWSLMKGNRDQKKGVRMGQTLHARNLPFLRLSTHKGEKLGMAGSGLMALP